MKAITTKIFALCIISITFASGTLSTVAQIEDTLNLVNHIGGRVNDLAVDGDRVYVASGGKLVILDLSDPENPVELGKTEPVPIISAIDVVDTTVYVVSGRSIGIIDVSDPSEPTYINFSSYHVDGDGRAIDVVDNVAYVADWKLGLVTIDVNDSMNPQFRHAVGEELRMVYDVEVNGTLAFVAVRNGGLYIYETSYHPIYQPDEPYLIGHHRMIDNGRGITLEGDVAFMDEYGVGLITIDVSDPQNPVRLAEFGVSMIHIDVIDTIAYVASSPSLHIFDVSDANNPIQLSSFDIIRYGQIVRVQNDIAYVWDTGSYTGQDTTVDHRALQIIDVRDRLAPRLIDSYLPATEVSDVKVEGNIAYIADLGNGLLTIDVTDPHNLEHLATFDDVAHASSVHIANDVAFTAQYSIYARPNVGFHAVDVSNSRQPFMLNRFTDFNRGIVETVGNTAYFVGPSQLSIVDISIPDSYTVLGEYEYLEGDLNCWRWSKVAIANDVVYISCNGQRRISDNEYIGVQELLLIDISDSCHPSILSNISSEYANEIDIVGDRLYVANEMNDLMVLDVSDPSMPTLMTHIETLGHPKDVEVVGDLAYIANETSGTKDVVVLDISDIENPNLVASFDTLHTAQRIHVTDDIVYVVTYLGEMYMLENVAARPAKTFPETESYNYNVMLPMISKSSSTSLHCD